MKQNAILVFVRQPKLGKVKTRLAKGYGKEKALAIYIQLLEHTKNITLPVDADKFVYYADGVPENDLWKEADYNRYPQIAGDLGDKMKAALQDLFNKGYKKITVIGSDCIELTTEIINQSFSQLIKNDVVLGPVLDGGYYLIAMNNYYPFLMEDIDWSTEYVLIQTLEKASANELKTTQLVKLSDIDYKEDWERYLRNKK